MIAILKTRTLKYLAMLTVSAFTLQSCYVAKDYTRPKLDEIEHLYRTDALPTDSLSMSDMSWKELFSDPYLVQYIEQGLQNNIDIRVAIQQVLAAEAYVKQGKAGFLPTLNANANATRSYFSDNGQQGAARSGSGKDHYDQFQIGGNLSWEADIWGKIRSNKRAIEADYLRTVAAHQAVKSRLIADIAATYYQLLALDAQLEITKKTISVRDSSVSTIKILKDAGNVTQVAVDQNIAQYNSARALQVDLETAIFQTENTLSILLGQQPQNYARSGLEDQHLQSDIKLGVPSTLLRNRPDVIAAEYNLVSAFEMTNVARSNFYPSLTLTAGGGLQSMELDELFSTSSLFANIVGGLTQPILNQRKIRTQKEVAEVQQEQALLEFKRSLLIAGNEVSNALFAYNQETKKFEYRQLEVEALRNAENNSMELLKNGFANYLDLLLSRQSALNSELNMIDSKLKQLLTIVDLYEALGGGWK
ncbi:NodT family efflux transporter outer membrane factor (OMF) lipoprotein [Gelidibacter sediminis]|uniref:NodT family efflux transporter outer membrane factor (OMF) lipoprotein n=1 Tax=Gelidibacter sediminis TaxID=1608710 RepID=A0A4R7Q916_9FLAO|nr:efflux transporter outer membrane subunit [Gelidibacter sediminis]TDU43321.1 NodT family efflux transporter outer membrane factor (OMF) lipoprotein [Gelidibacter sediminis]